MRTRRMSTSDDPRVGQLVTTTGPKRVVWDTNTNVLKLHDSTNDLTTRDTRPNHTTTGLALWSSLTLETGSHPWVPAGHPQCTGAHHDGEAVDGPKPPQVTRKPLRAPTWLRSKCERTSWLIKRGRNVRDCQCDDSRMAYSIESLDHTQFEQKESTQQIADHRDMTEDYKDHLSNSRVRTKDTMGKRAISLGSGVSEEHSRSSINLTEELSQETSSARRLNELTNQAF